MGDCIKSNDVKSCCSNSMDIVRIVVEEALKIIAKHTPMRSVALFQTGSDTKCCICGIGSPISIVEEKIKNITFRNKTNVDHTLYTYPLSFICNISNQYRIRNDIDRYSFGRSPWIIEPLDILIVTDGRSLSDGINMSNLSTYPCIGNEFSEGNFRWDHRIYLFIINADADSHTNIPKDMVDLILNSGGEIIFSGSVINKAIEDFNKLMNSIIITPFCGIKFSTSNSCSRLKLKSITGEWPIPEFIGKKDIALRPTHPTLKVDQIQSDCLELAKHLDINLDTYEILTSDLSNVTVNKNDTNYIRSVSIIDNFHKFTSLPFAIIAREKNKLELIIMPYNYPVLLKIIKSAMDAKRSHDVGHNWIQIWRTQLDDYIRTLPGYYYNPTFRMLKRFGLPFPNVEYNLNRNFIKRLKNIQSIAASEIVLLEAAEHKKWEYLPKDAVQIAIGSVEMQRGLLETPYDAPLSTSLSGIKSYDLLGSLEKMRMLLYGGSQALSCNGLYTNDKTGASSSVGCSFTAADIDDWFGQATGAYITRQSKITDAGRYLNVLAKQEAHRDPQDITNSQNEDTINEVLKRKFSVHFGNRYASSKTKIKASESSSSSVAIDEGIAFGKDSIYTAEEFLIDSPAPHRNTGSSTLHFDRKIQKSQMIPATQENNENKVDIEKVSTSKASASPTSVSSPIVSKLPEGWVEGFSKTHSRVFWFHAGRNESVWKRPI